MKLEPGFIFVIPYEVIRPATDKEEAEVDGIKTVIDNKYGNLYWVKAYKANSKPILVCFDGYVPDKLKRFSEIGQEIVEWMK